MEQNPTVLAKKVWNLVRVAYYMLRKGVSKRKVFLDLNMMIKRGKIARKALQNLMFHHHHNNREDFTTNHRSHHLSFPSPPSGEYVQFSCSSSPATSDNPFSLFSHHKKQHSNSKPSENLDIMALNAVLQAMEMIHSENSSPALPGFGSTPMVRQLRVTDSPFPLSSVDEDNQVNEAADQFISRFYNDLRQQNNKASFGSS